jgi:putative PIN family toxin of toxin-antitoxin system
VIRAVLDVNVLLSAIIAPLGYSHRVVQAWESGLFLHISSLGIIDGLTQKLALGRIARKYNVHSEDRHWGFALLATQTEVVAVRSHEIRPVTLDHVPEDDYVVATAHVGQADYLVTGDRKLLELGGHGRVCIVTPKQFYELLNIAAD